MFSLIRLFFWLKMYFLYLPNALLKFSFDRVGSKKNWLCRHNTHEWKIYASSGMAGYPIVRCCRCNEDHPKLAYDVKFNLVSYLGLLFWLITCPIWGPILIWKFIADLIDMFQE